MNRNSAQDFPPEVLRQFDLYVHGLIPRREFIARCGRLGAGIAGAEVWLTALSPQFAAAQQVAPADPRLTTGRVAYPSPKGYGSVHGYLVRPAHAAGPLPVILVVHENRGLNPHIEDIARRLALDGYVVFAPDALYPLGGYPNDEDKARELFGKLDQEKTHEDFLAAARAMQGVAGGNGRLGAIGFCYGGGMVNFLATRMPELAAAVPFYGAQPSAEDTAHIRSPLLIHYAGQDERINAGWPAFEAALKANKIAYEAFIYPGVQHGFNNDTTPRYDAAAAKLAWSRTEAFFKEHLQA